MFDSPNQTNNPSENSGENDTGNINLGRDTAGAAIEADSALNAGESASGSA